METGFKVSDAMTRSPVKVSSSVSVQSAARLMMRKHVGSLLVVDRGALKGIFTEGDLTCRVVARGLNPTRTFIRDVMTKDVIALEPELDIYDALVQMNAFEIRHAPIKKKDKLVGFLTLKDILKIQPDLFDLILDRLHVREEKKKPIHELKIVE